MGQNEDKTELIPRIVAEVFELNGIFLREGDRLTAPYGQTSARWSVLSVVSDGPRTVPQIARRLGLTRQSIQRTANLLVEDGLLEPLSNPDHLRSPLLQLTPLGEKTLEGISTHARAWWRSVAKGLPPEELRITLQTLQELIKAATSQEARKDEA